MTTLRSDARRNREKILAAASELFAQRGAEVSVSDIARMAGVGHATVFRRFPTKESLVLALLEQRVEALSAVAEGALAHEDAFEGLRAAMAYMAESQARDRASSRPWAPSSSAAIRCARRATGRSRRSPPCCAAPRGRARCATTWSRRT
jgi:AcrR family transcriptional regulator